MKKIEYQLHVLANGLRVIVYEAKHIPRVTVNLLYNVGAKDENPNKTGFAHLFEHLMFGGSRNIPSYDTPLQKAGGENNAFTTNDITNYYISLPAHQLEMAFWLESDRMLELDFSQKSLDIQKSVVIEEFKQRYLNQPYGDAHLLLRPIHYTKHPYQWPTIGKEISHIEDATLEDVVNFFYGFYAPNNATLVVAGDVKTSEVLQLAQKWFGDIPARTLMKRPLPKEPKQIQARSATVTRDVPYAGVYKAWHIPERTHPDYYALDLITDLLSGGRTGKLFQYLVKEQEIAHSIAAFSWNAFDPGMISIDGKINPGHSVEAYEEAVARVMDNLMDVNAKDLQRVKNKAEASAETEFTSLMNIGLSLAIGDSLGNPDLVNQTLPNYLEVSREDIHRVTTEYLTPENCSTLYYLPQNER
jgi:zinc protease